MAKALRCKHIGPDPDCQFVAQGETEEEILKQFTHHGTHAHNITEYPDELVQIALSKIEED